MNIDHWRQKKAIEALDKFSGNHTSLITLLMPPDTQLNRISKLLIQEIGTASSIKSKMTRQNVLEGLKCIQQRMRIVSWLPKNGLAIFCGIVQEDENGKTRKMITALEPIKPINIFTYRCDSKFLTDPLKEMLEVTEKYGFLIVDGSGCLLATVQGNSETILHRFNVSLPKKHGRGGQSALRFARLRLEARHNYVTKCSELATKYFIDPATNKPNVKGLVAAGFADLKENVAKALDPRLQSVMIDAVDIAYGGQQGLQQAIELTSETLKNITLVSQKKILAGFFDQLRQDTGKVCYGVEDILAALEAGAVDKLLVWEDLSTVRHEMQNNKTGEKKIVYTKPEEQPRVADKSEGVWEVVESTSLVDWFAEHFEKFGAELELVQDSTPEGSQFAKGFGGVGGLLRYKMELPSLTLENAEEVDDGKQEESKDEDEEEDFWN